MTRRHALGSVSLWACALALSAGCAPIPQATSVPGRPVTTGTRAATRAGAAAPPPVVHAPVDSLPSPDALQVLATIPEPLKPGERVPPPLVTHPGADSSAAAPDTSIAPADTVGADVPIPSPTPVLGERSNAPWNAPPDSAAKDSSRGGGSKEPPAGPPSGSGSQSSGSPGRGAETPSGPAPGAGAQGSKASCWRVQIAAPIQRQEADKKRLAAESLLLVPMVIEHEAKLWKIRTRDCFERSVADGIRERAKGSGFAGAFPFQAKP